MLWLSVDYYLHTCLAAPVAITSSADMEDNTSVVLPTKLCIFLATHGNLVPPPDNITCIKVKKKRMNDKKPSHHHICAVAHFPVNLTAEFCPYARRFARNQQKPSLVMKKQMGQIPLPACEEVVTGRLTGLMFYSQCLFPSGDLLSTIKKSPINGLP